MGSSTSRTLNLKNVNEHYANCDILGNKICPIYGEIQCVNYKGMDFNIAKSQQDDPNASPHPLSIHYLVDPGHERYLIFPDFTLLEDLSPNSLNDLLSIISGICQMSLSSEEGIGIGYNRLCYNVRWGIAGELPTDWAFRTVWENGACQGIFLSPQQMIALSRKNTNYDPIKADMFALGIMLVQVVFKEPIGHIYNFDRFQINLNPLLQKLTLIKEQYGEQIVSLFTGMLQIEQEDRFDFSQLLRAVEYIQNPQVLKSNNPLNMINSNSSHRNLQYSKGLRAANNASPYSRTPKNIDKGLYRNDVSPFKGRFGPSVKNSDKSRKTPERAQQSRSPMRRQGGKQLVQNNFMRQDFSTMQRVSPLGRR